MIWLRSALFNLLFFAWTTALLVVGIPFMATSWRTPLIHVAWLWTKGVVALMRWIVDLRCEVRGNTELLQHAAIVAANHQSAWDTFIFHVVARDPAYVMKSELLAVPLYGWFARKQGSIAIDRKGASAALRELVEKAELALAEDRPVVIFPQGTRVTPGMSAPYLPGIAALYTRLGRPVVPVALNSGLFWGRRRFLKHPGTIVLEILEPIAPGLARAAFMAELERRIEDALQRLEAEARAAAGWRP